MVDSTFNGNVWSRFTNKHSEYIYIFRTIKASSGEYRLLWFTIILVLQIYIYTIQVCILLTMP